MGGGGEVNKDTEKNGLTLYQPKLSMCESGLRNQVHSIIPIALYGRSGYIHAIALYGRSGYIHAIALYGRSGYIHGDIRISTC